MFASLKSKIKEETGSDISKLTSSWRTGAFLGRITLRDDSSSTTSPSSSGGHGDSTSDSISPQLQTYLTDRTGCEVDNVALQQQYTAQLEAKLRERDAYWEQRVEELQQSLAAVQGEEAAAAQAVARIAQSEAAKATSERDLALRQLNDLKTRLAAVETAQDRLDTLTEEIEQSRRQWARERAELTGALGEADARARDLADQLEVLRAALPPDNPHHHMHDDDKRELVASGCAEHDRVVRERAVLARQLQEAKMALADVKTSWSGQIASLETQEKTMEFESRLEKLLEENKKLSEELEKERDRVQGLQENAETSSRSIDKQKMEVTRLGSLVTELQQHAIDMQKKYEKEKREKDEALLRNAHMSQTMELSERAARHLRDELAEERNSVKELEQLIAEFKENEATCMIIKQNEKDRTEKIDDLKQRIVVLIESETDLKKSIQNLETDIRDKNKKIKTLENRILDMKKTFHRELQTSKSELTSAEEQDISRRYLKHVVLRFVTGREGEAPQLTRALAALLRLSANEEASLRAALPPRAGLAAWLPAMPSLASLHT